MLVYPFIILLGLFFGSVLPSAHFVRPEPAQLQTLEDRFGVDDPAQLDRVIKTQLTKVGIKERDYMISMVKNISVSLRKKSDDDLILDSSDILLIVANPSTAGELQRNLKLSLRMMEKIIEHRHWKSFQVLADVFKCIQPELQAFFERITEMLEDGSILSSDSVAVAQLESASQNNNSIGLAVKLTFLSFVIAGVTFPLALPSITKGVFLGALGGAAGALVLEGFWRRAPQPKVIKKMQEGAVYGGLSGAVAGFAGNALPVGYATALSQDGALVVESAVKSSCVSSVVSVIRNFKVANPLKTIFKDGLKGGITTGVKTFAMNTTKPLRDLVSFSLLSR